MFHSHMRLKSIFFLKLTNNKLNIGWKMHPLKKNFVKNVHDKTKARETESS